MEREKDRNQVCSVFDELLSVEEELQNIIAEQTFEHDHERVLSTKYCIAMELYVDQKDYSLAELNFAKFI